MAAHGAFFVLNPISTFSWQVFVVRKCLGLDSVPILTDNDFYLQTRKHFKISNRDGLWVSFVSIAEAANDIRKSLELVE